MRIVLVYLALFFSGCASTQYGNFLDNEKQYSFIAVDALVKLNDLYPPARTKFYFIHDIDNKDMFGDYFISELRARGYGVQEYAKTTPSGTKLGYTLDRINDLYRVTLYLDGERLSRLYLIKSDSVIPIGAWTLSIMEVGDER